MDTIPLLEHFNSIEEMQKVYNICDKLPELHRTPLFELGRNMNKEKTHVIFGVTGQIGSYLAEYIIGKGEKVVGVARRVSNDNTERISQILDNPLFQLRAADITDPFSLLKLFNDIVVDKNVEYVVYNLAAMSHVHISFAQPIVSAEVTGVGHLNILEILLPLHKLGFKIKVYNQSSSEIFGSNIGLDNFQDLQTPFFPNSPYAAAKLYAYHINRIYKESYGMFTTSGIIFNTESPRRGSNFVTRKITKWFSKFMCDNFVLTNRLVLGNIQAYRDWTHAVDSVKAIYLIANNNRPKDYVVSSGETHTIYEFLEQCYTQAQILMWNKIPYKLEDLFEINDEFKRPNEVKYLKGNSSEIRSELGWKPQLDFKYLVHDMLYSDYCDCKNIKGY